jgi:prepilin-type processing-associated H-X9-DG protein
VGILGFLFLSMWSGAKQLARGINCTNHLKEIGLAYLGWSLDNGDKFPMQVSVTQGGTKELGESADAFVHFQALSSEAPGCYNFCMTNPGVLVCPADANRTAAVSWSTNFSNKNLSYFVNLDAGTGDSPTNILAGDRNLTLNGRPVLSGLLKLRTDSPVGWSKKLHNNRGHIVFADGHAASHVTNLQPFLLTTGFVTNRLAIP